ncbi:MAG: hypothetical protein ACYSWO_21795 [Planctomycetota bacterium]|jgi:hypothetical protein
MNFDRYLSDGADKLGTLCDTGYGPHLLAGMIIAAALAWIVLEIRK